MDKEILELLERYKRDFDRDTQRTELLLRNEKFLKELKDIKKILGGNIFFKIRDIRPGEILINKTKENILLKNDYPKNPIYRWKKYADKITIGQDINRRLNILHMEYIPKWKEFCDRWNIISKWNGNLSSLKKYLKAPVELHRIENKEKGTSAIFIRIDNWTIINDIRKVWKDVEEYQNKIWKKQEKRTNFARDLCWYDLSKKYGLKARQIAEIWIDGFPEDIDLLVIRRIKKEIDKKDLKRKVLDDSELLYEIKSGFLAEKYGSYFKEEKVFYTTGQSIKGKFDPPFIDVIKKALKRMEEQINHVNIQYFSSPEELERFLFLAKRIRIE